MNAHPTKQARKRWTARLRGLMAAIRSAVVVVVAAGCDPGPNPKSAPAATAEGSAEVARLRSLGYLDFAPENQDPPDAPDGPVVLDPRATCPGYNLYNDRTTCTAHLIDADGNVINRWKDTSCGYWAAAHLMPNGDLVAAGTSSKNPEGYDRDSFVVRMSWEGKVRWRTALTAHHDITTVPGGFLTLTFDQRREPDVSPDVLIRDNLIAVLRETGGVVSEHSLYSAFRETAPDQMQVSVQPYEMNGEPAFDLFHANSVVSLDRSDLRDKHRMFAPGNVLVSMRHQDLIAAVHLPTNRVVWTWGRGELSGQHDASVLDNGNILIFDNGLSREASRAIELDPSSSRIVWQYNPASSAFFSVAGGNAQRLANGNTLLVNYDKGFAFEVTPDGSTVWEFRNPLRNQDGHRGVIGKMRRYPVEFVEKILDAAGLAAAPDLTADVPSHRPTSSPAVRVPLTP